MIDHCEVLDSYGEPYNQMLTYAHILRKLLERTMTGKQVELLRAYGFVLEDLEFISESYAFEKGFLAGKQADPKEKIVRNMERLDGMIRNEEERVTSVDLRELAGYDSDD